MKSIRLSLMVYFLALLAVALLSASLLVYRNAEETLTAKQKAMEQLIQKQYDERCQKEKARLDAGLLAQAQLLASMVEVQISRRYPADRTQACFRLGVIASSLNPSGYFLMPLWIAESERPPSSEMAGSMYADVRRHLPPDFRQQLKLDEMPLPSESQVGEYFQIDSPPSKSYHSRALGDRSFPLDTSAFDPEEVAHWIFDDTVLPPYTPVRRVVFKASGVARGFLSSRPSPSPGNPPPHRGPTIYVHCAAQKDKLEAALAGFGKERDDELNAVADNTRQSLCELRVWLLAISLAVFAATGIGGFWLVRLGLSPLRRLSDAVSRVSAKDFRLPLDNRPLPWELQPIAKRLSSTLDLLKRTFAREKQAVADISHELRTPLAALMTTTEFALRKPRSPEQYRELLGDCLTSAQQMNQIVERLLTLARLDAGVDRLRVQAVDAVALAQQCVAVVRPLAEARGLKLLVKCPVDAQAEDGDSACVVRTDGDKLREIVTNLLHNAIQYNRPGGSVMLRLARENGTLDVEVEDTGIGMTAETREHIFERFYRADPSRGGDDLHAGLGLAIVKEYIDLMGGSIGVDSTVGQGSTFRVHLPVQ